MANQSTRGLNIGATRFVHETPLRQGDVGKCVLLISASLDEILGVSDRVVVVYKSRIIRTLNREETGVHKTDLLMGGITEEVVNERKIKNTWDGRHRTRRSGRVSGPHYVARRKPTRDSCHALQGHIWKFKWVHGSVCKGNPLDFYGFEMRDSVQDRPFQHRREGTVLYRGPYLGVSGPYLNWDSRHAPYPVRDFDGIYTWRSLGSDNRHV